MYFARKYYLGTLFFGLSYWRRDRHFTWSSEAREGLPVCRAKGVPSFLSYFKTLSISPVPAKLTLPRLTIAGVPPQVINKENHGIKSIGYSIKKMTHDILFNVFGGLLISPIRFHALYTIM